MHQVLAFKDGLECLAKAQEQIDNSNNTQAGAILLFSFSVKCSALNLHQLWYRILRERYFMGYECMQKWVIFSQTRNYTILNGIILKLRLFWLYIFFLLHRATWSMGVPVNTTIYMDTLTGKSRWHSIFPVHSNTWCWNTENHRQENTQTNVPWRLSGAP